MTISCDTRYQQLVELLYAKLGFEPDKCVLKLTTRFPTVQFEQSPVFTMTNDDDIKFFIRYCGKSGIRLAELMIVVEEKLNRSEPTVKPLEKNGVTWAKTIFCSSSGSNQISDSMPAISSPFPCLNANEVNPSPPKNDTRLVDNMQDVQLEESDDLDDCDNENGNDLPTRNDDDLLQSKDYPSHDDDSLFFNNDLPSINDMHSSDVVNNIDSSTSTHNNPFDRALQWLTPIPSQLSG